MAYARVVSFDGVSKQRIEQMKEEMSGEGPPDEIPATEMMVLYDEGAQKSLAIVFFDNEEDYAAGHAVLDAMPRDDTPGNRTSVTKTNVAVRMKN